jgi:ParB family transcriptional regulator, chromosome partitioning protein
MKKTGSVLDLFADLTEPAIGAEGYERGHRPQPLLIALADIQPDPNQPRKEFDPEQIDNLAESIRKVGILQPLLLAETSATPPFRIIEGERRWLAAQRAGLLEVPAYVRHDLSSEEIALAQVIANANRTDLTDFELAQAIQTLLDTQRIKKKEVAVLINKSLSTVSRLLGMLNPDVPPYVEEGLIRHAEVSARFQSLTNDQRMALVEQARSEGTEITTTMVRELQLHARQHALIPVQQQDQDAEASAAEPISPAGTDGSNSDLSLRAESGGDTNHLSNSPPETLCMFPGPGSAGAAGAADSGADDAAIGGQSAFGGDKANRKKETIDLKVTVPHLNRLVFLLNAAFGAHGLLLQQSMVIRMPLRFAVALIEAMGATAPESPAEYADTILKLLKQSEASKFASDANFTKTPQETTSTPGSGT